MQNGVYHHLMHIKDSSFWKQPSRTIKWLCCEMMGEQEPPPSKIARFQERFIQALKQHVPVMFSCRYLTYVRLLWAAPDFSTNKGGWGTRSSIWQKWGIMYRLDLCRYQQVT